MVRSNVYDFCHMGHARVMVMFDVITRHLRRNFPSVKYVRNITDIDDKIITRAIENNVYIVGTNMCGTHHTNRKTYGHSIIVSPWGKILNKGYKKPKIINSKINLEEVKKIRRKIPSLTHD